MKTKCYAITLLFLLKGPLLWAQHGAPDPIGKALFPPELIMRNQTALGLEEDQRNFIKAEIVKANALFTDWEWDLQNAMQTMVSLLDQDPVDEEKVLARLDNITGLENNIKRTRLSLAIRIKNILSPEQKTKLKTLKKARRERNAFREEREKRERMGLGRGEKRGPEPGTPHRD